jgi:cell division protein FtsN
MSRDYKNTRGGKSGSGISGTAGFLIGLAIGLGIAAAVYIHERKPPEEHPTKPTPARSAHEKAEENLHEEAGRKFDFYEMLPKFEVVVPEREKAEASDARPAAIQRPGAYVLQAGSYRNFADADRVRAQLALQGIESKVQKVAVDNDTWHRVRIGPISDLTELNRTREKLRQADIEALVIRVGE